MAKRGDFSEAQRKEWQEQTEAKKKVLTEKLNSRLLSLGTNEAWVAWIRAARHYPRLSFQNQLLIISQQAERGYPDEQVASYTAWRKLGRAVRKGEIGLGVFAPMAYKYQDTEASAEGEQSEEKTRMSYKVSYEFSESQLEPGPPLPTPAPLLDGEDPDGCFAKLEAIAIHEGLTVERRPLNGHLNGFYDRSKKLIVVRDADSVSPLQALKTMSHELMHFYDTDVPGDCSRADKEVVAETGAYLLLGSVFDLDSSQYTTGYIATWSQGDAKIAIQKIKELGGRINKGVRAITDALEEQAGNIKPTYEPRERSRGQRTRSRNERPERVVNAQVLGQA